MSQELRALPCCIQPEDKLWYIAGGYRDSDGWGGGILEWCYDQEDAESELARLKQDTTGRYEGLVAGKYCIDDESEGE